MRYIEDNVGGPSVSGFFVIDAARIPGLSREARECLESYRWPGNVRELLSALEASRAMAAPGRVIEVQHLPAAGSGAATVFFGASTTACIGASAVGFAASAAGACASTAAFGASATAAGLASAAGVADDAKPSAVFTAIARQARRLDPGLDRLSEPPGGSCKPLRLQEPAWREPRFG